MRGCSQFTFGKYLWSQASQIRRGGPAVTVRKLQSLMGLLVARMILVAIRALRPLVLIRFGVVPSHQIGGLAPVPEIYLCERDAGLHGPKALDIFCYDPRGISNYQLKKMWGRTVPVLPFTGVTYRLNEWLPETHRIPWNQDEVVDISGLLPSTQPHLSFTEKEEQTGQAALREMGIPERAPFVCFHARDTAYVTSVKSESDRPGSTFRNCSIVNFLPAVEELVQRGYYALRMGSVMEEPLPYTSERVIDYATNERTDFLDVYLTAKCHLYLGCTSGLYAIPQIFRRPWIITNAVPLQYVASWGPKCLILPKKIWSRDQGRNLSFRELLDSEIWLLRETEHYEERGIDLIQNTAEEIAAVAVEMDERLKGTWLASEEDEELQKQFWSYFKPPELESALASRMGADFLRDNRALLE